MHSTNRTRTASLLREMAAAGIPVDLSVPVPAVEIAQVGGVCDSMVFDLPDGRAGCIADLCITNQTSRPIQIRSVELLPPWPDSEFEWLPDPRETGRDPLNYCFPGKGAPELPRDQVINHVVCDGGILRPKRSIEGWLLAIGNPKPEKLLPGVFVDFTLAILGCDHSEYGDTIRLRVDPIMKYERPSMRKRSTESLFTREGLPNRASQKPSDKTAASLRR